eukprot:SAG31_NODE_11793_length_997_cov_5.443207_1_plen_270_part_01
MGAQGAVVLGEMLTSGAGEKLIAAMRSLLIHGNPIGAEGAQAFIDALPQTQITELGIGNDLRLRFDEECISLDASKQGLGVGAAMLLAYWLRWEGAEGRSLIAALGSLDLSNNPGILGKLDECGELETADAHVEQFKQLATAIGQLRSLTSLNLASIGMGAQGAVVFSEMLTSGGGEKLFAAMRFLIIGGSPIGAEGAQALIDALPQTQITELGIGKDLRLRFDEECFSLDASKQGLGVGEAMLLAYWLRWEGAEGRSLIAALGSLDLSN